MSAEFSDRGHGADEIKLFCESSAGDGWSLSIDIDEQNGNTSKITNELLVTLARFQHVNTPDHTKMIG